MSKLSTCYKKLIFISLAVLLAAPSLSWAESYPAELGKSIEQSYLKAREMGTNATTAKIQQANRPQIERTSAALARDVAALSKSFVEKNQSLTQIMIKKMQAAAHKGEKEHPGKTATGGKDLADTNNEPAAKTPTDQNRVQGTGHVTGAAGAKSVGFGGAQREKHPEIDESGIIQE